MSEYDIPEGVNPEVIAAAAKIKARLDGPDPFLPSFATSAVRIVRTVSEKTAKGVRIGLKLAQQLIYAVANVVAGATAPPRFVARDWQIDFTIAGKKGEKKIVTNVPQCLFRGEKMMATDSSKVPGMGTRIGAIFVGQSLQRPAFGGGTLTVFFSQNALGNGIKWDTCQPGLAISIEIQFDEDCEWTATVFGKAAMGHVVPFDRDYQAAA